MTIKPDPTICDICGGIDTAPKHVVAYLGQAVIDPKPEHVKAAIEAEGLTTDQRAAILADVYDIDTNRRHITCCAASGCPTNSCQEG